LAVDFDHNYDVEKNYFRPSVLSRIWYLGPCDDLLQSPPARTAVDHVVNVERERGHDDDNDNDDDDEDDALPPVTNRDPQTGNRTDSVFPSS
jgi:hypothetical protein